MRASVPRFGPRALASGMLAALAVAGTVIAAKPAVLTTALNGQNEISPAGQPAAGDPDGAGTSKITLKEGKKPKVCFALAVQNIDPAVAAHIHQGVAGTNGPIVVNLVPPDAKKGKSKGCASPTDATADEMAQIRANPAGFYVNVHTTEFSGGAVRGQLQVDDK